MRMFFVICFCGVCHLPHMYSLVHSHSTVQHVLLWIIFINYRKYCSNCNIDAFWKVSLCLDIHTDVLRWLMIVFLKVLWLWVSIRRMIAKRQYICDQNYCKSKNHLSLVWKDCMKCCYKLFCGLYPFQVITEGWDSNKWMHSTVDLIFSYFHYFLQRDVHIVTI